MPTSTNDHPQETIAAIASASGVAPRGIIRISGPTAVETALAVFESATPVDHVSTTARAIAGQFLLDHQRRMPGQLLLWPTTRSYTREPVAELHTIGSPPLLEMLLARVCRQGVRLALPGEFTLRAFLAGRIDLTQAEAVLGVIDARGEAGLRAALDQLAGGLSAPLHRLRGLLLDQLAHLEAGLDFVEEDIEFITRDELLAALHESSDTVVKIAAQVASRATAASQIRIVLYGWPNVGKSSLFNALVGQQEAIVADVPGTTRDYLAAEVSISGAACTLIDTAGTEPAACEPLSLAARRMSDRSQQTAEIGVLCIDASREPNAWERNQLALTPPAPRLIVATKTDLADGQPLPADWIATSSTQNTGLDRLQQRLGECLSESLPGETGIVASTAARCAESLGQAAAALERGIEAAEAELGEEFVAEELRLALHALGEVVGAFYTDDLLDRIFSRFCIGK